MEIEHIPIKERLSAEQDGGESSDQKYSRPTRQPPNNPAISVLGHIRLLHPKQLSVRARLPPSRCNAATVQILRMVRQLSDGTHWNRRVSTAGIAAPTDPAHRTERAVAPAESC